MQNEEVYNTKMKLQHSVVKLVEGVDRIHESYFNLGDELRHLSQTLNLLREQVHTLEIDNEEAVCALQNSLKKYQQDLNPKITNLRNLINSTESLKRQLSFL